VRLLPDCQVLSVRVALTTPGANHLSWQACGDSSDDLPHEASRLSHIAVASRNQIVRWFHRRAQRQGSIVQAALKEHQRAIENKCLEPSLAEALRFAATGAWVRCRFTWRDMLPQALVKRGDRDSMRRQYVQD